MVPGDGGINATFYRSHIHLKNKLRCFLKYPPHYSVCCLLFLYSCFSSTSSLFLPTNLLHLFSHPITVFFSLLPLVYLYDPLHLPVLLHLTPFLLLYIVSWLLATHTSLLCFTIIPTCGSFVDCAIEQNHCQIFIIIK